MGLGILESRLPGNIPGTAFMGGGTIKHSLSSSSIADHRRLKCDKSGPEPIVLIPQPSDDPNDPLNWPLWQRDIITIVLCLISIMAATLGPILAADTLVLAFHFRVSFTKIALLTGWHLCGVGIAGFIFVPTARVWGKRHLYILGTVLLIVSSVWAGKAQSYNSLLGARVLQGVAVCPFESLVNASVGDLYCVHHRGKRMAFTNFALYGGAFFTPVVVGKITATLGWRWTFYLVAIFSAAMLPLVFFLVPETAFRRSNYLNTDINSLGAEVVTAGKDAGEQFLLEGDENTPNVGSSESEKTKGQVSSSNSPLPSDLTPVPAVRDSWVKRLALFNGRKTDDGLFKLVLRPLVLLFHPAMIWGMLTQGALIGWTVLIGVVFGIIFMGPPLWYNEEKTGYLYTGAFIGAVLGFALSGPLADWSARFLTKRNNGVYEPEFRIVLVIPQMIIGVLGVYGFGFTAADVKKYGWFWPVFFFGLEVMGMIIGAVASALYLVDAHRDIAIEAFTCLLLFKNFFSFALTWGAIDWVQDTGTWETFRIIGAIQVFVCLLSIPMYIFGKRNRALMWRHDILKAAKLD